MILYVIAIPEGCEIAEVWNNIVNGVKILCPGEHRWVTIEVDDDDVLIDVVYDPFENVVNFPIAHQSDKLSTVGLERLRP